MNLRMDQSADLSEKVWIKIDNLYTVKHLTQSNVIFSDNSSNNPSRVSYIGHSSAL